MLYIKCLCTYLAVQSWLFEFSDIFVSVLNLHWYLKFVNAVLAHLLWEYQQWEECRNDRRWKNKHFTCVSPLNFTFILKFVNAMLAHLLGVLLDRSTLALIYGCSVHPSQGISLLCHQCYLHKNTSCCKCSAGTPGRKPQSIAIHWSNRQVKQKYNYMNKSNLDEAKDHPKGIAILFTQSNNYHSFTKKPFHWKSYTFCIEHLLLRKLLRFDIIPITPSKMIESLVKMPNMIDGWD